MFDIGFAELIIIGIVGLLVIGPERLPGAIRTGAQWLSHFKRSFTNIKREIEQEMDIDAVKQQVLKANEGFKSQTEDFKQGLEDSYNKSMPGPESDISDDHTSEPSVTPRPRETGE